MDHLLDPLQTLVGSPQQTHALLVHMPIAAAFLGLFMTLVLIFSGGRSHGVRWACVLTYLLGAALAFMAAEAGEEAAEQLSLPLSPPAQAVLIRHQELAEPIWVGMVAAAVLVMASTLSSPALRVTALTLAMIGGVFVAGWVGLAAHHGGQLVYRYGVGVPQTPDNLQRRAAPPPRPDTPVPDPQPSDEPHDEMPSDEPQNEPVRWPDRPA